MHVLITKPRTAIGSAKAALLRCAQRYGNHDMTVWRYTVLRFLLGAYLAIHFAELLPYSAELFSSQGMLPSGESSPLLHAFPNVLALWDSATFVNGFVALGLGASVLLAVGTRDGWAAGIAWYVLTCLFGRNPMIGNPSLPYVGLLLLAHCSVRCCAPRDDQRMSKPVFGTLFFLMAVGYSYSGITKLLGPSWVDGSALAHLLRNPLARGNALGDLLLAAPPAFHMAATYGVLALELLYLPLSFIHRARFWLGWLMLGVHVSLLLLMDFADLTFGMVILHLFLQPARSGSLADSTVNPYDGPIPSAPTPPLPKQPSAHV